VINHKSCGHHDRQVRQAPWWGHYERILLDGNQHYYWVCPWCYTCIVVSEAEYQKHKGENDATAF